MKLVLIRHQRSLAGCDMFSCNVEKLTADAFTTASLPTRNSTAISFRNIQSDERQISNHLIFTEKKYNDQSICNIRTLHSFVDAHLCEDLLVCFRCRSFPAVCFIVYFGLYRVLLEKKCISVQKKMCCGWTVLSRVCWYAFICVKAQWRTQTVTYGSTNGFFSIY